jgi:hypothetical protein
MSQCFARLQLYLLKTILILMDSCCAIMIEVAHVHFPVGIKTGGQMALCRPSDNIFRGKPESCLSTSRCLKWPATIHIKYPGLSMKRINCDHLSSIDIFACQVTELYQSICFHYSDNLNITPETTAKVH